MSDEETMCDCDDAYDSGSVCAFCPTEIRSRCWWRQDTSDGLSSIDICMACFPMYRTMLETSPPILCSYDEVCDNILYDEADCVNCGLRWSSDDEQEFFFTVCLPALCICYPCYEEGLRFDPEYFELYEDDGVDF